MLSPSSRLLTVSFALAVAAAACTVGSGDLGTETRDVSGFSEIVLSTSGRLTITQTGTESLTIEAEDNILPMLTSDVSGRRLDLGSTGSFTSRRDINYTLTVADLESVTISGSGSATASEVSTGTLVATISGSGSLNVAGAASDLRVRVSGSGSFDGENLTAATGTVTISGSGGAVVNVTDDLTAEVSGSGSVTYLGSPTVSQQITGSGSVSPG